MVSAVPGRGREAGFSLLEVLVAFAIMALTLGVLLRIFAGGARSTHIADAYARAAEVAQSTLALAGNEYPLAPGVQQGEENGYRWTLEMTPAQANDLVAPPPRLSLLKLTARVSWSDGNARRSFQLESLRAVPGQGQ